MLLLYVVHKGQRKQKKIFWWYFSSRYACWNVWVYGQVSSKEIDNKTTMLMSMSHCPFFPLFHTTFILTPHFMYLHSYWRFFSSSCFSTIVNHYKGQRIYREGEVMTCIYAYWDWLSAVGLIFSYSPSPLEYFYITFGRISLTFILKMKK